MKTTMDDGYEVQFLARLWYHKVIIPSHYDKTLIKVYATTLPPCCALHTRSIQSNYQM